VAVFLAQIILMVSGKQAVNQGCRWACSGLAVVPVLAWKLDFKRKLQQIN